ncbi:MAG: SMP-30/gluconolactonase/LRE family protein [Bauldia sp.]|uniref:SMP-30/gluconolactonase/LRE family protein n=1 Tax=Bauldia sp. TaxID=2575872 RepID=UPI001D5845CA|nr:SMP-30/gluconolactonase/LRE family protein [Bauldia sp.]MCB1496807.1 SMP-30/gluconolactonase/LRE family protein [Bauldia sp.]
MIFAEGLGVPEGPVALSDGSWLVVEMRPDRGCVSRISPDGSERTQLAVTGRPNGLAFDHLSRIWVCESNPPSLLRMTLDGEYESILDHSDDGPFLFPNDLCFGPDGLLYFTDSGIRFTDFVVNGQVRDDHDSLDYQGRVYRVHPETLRLEVLAEGIRFTNGLAFGPGDTHLYVAETIGGDIIRYPWSPKGLGAAEVFGNTIDPDAPPGLKGPDGMAFGRNGALYVTVFGQGDVTVLGPDGGVRERIRTNGMAPTNVAFGRDGEHRIYVTEDELGTIEVFDVDTAGLPLHVRSAAR